MGVKQLLFGRAYFKYAIYDTALDFFENKSTVSKDIVYGGGSPPDDVYSVFSFLESDGMVISDAYSFSITEKGKVRRLSGGYRGDALRGRILAISAVIAAVASVISVVCVIAFR